MKRKGLFPKILLVFAMLAAFFVFRPAAKTVKPGYVKSFLSKEKSVQIYCCEQDSFRTTGKTAELIGLLHPEDCKRTYKKPESPELVRIYLQEHHQLVLHEDCCEIYNLYDGFFFSNGHVYYRNDGLDVSALLRWLETNAEVSENRFPIP